MQYGTNTLTLLLCVTCLSFVQPAAGVMKPTSEQFSQPVRLMSAHKDVELRERLPKVNDEEVQQILDDPTLIFYTDREIPAAYQDWGSGLPGIHSPSYNISANGSEPHGNGNVEFPWGAPGGTHRSKNVHTFRFFRLPKDDDGKIRPIVWYRQTMRGSPSPVYRWTFPVGTVIGEVLQIRSPQGQLYTFELRLREREYGAWSVNVFRPFPTSGRLAERIKQLRPHWQENEQLAKLVNHLEQPVELEPFTLADKRHSRVTFREKMGIDALPPVGDDELIAQLLTETVFESALGTVWRTGTNAVSTIAPTTDAAFHIVPARYDAGFIEVDRESCMRCHETVNRHVTDFDFGRDWYGRVRGSDGIFSIHPFDPNCISYNGTSLTARMNGKLIKAGVLEKFDRDRHADEVYQQLFPVER